MSNNRTPRTSPTSSPPPIRRRRREQRGPFQEQPPIARMQSHNSLASNTSAFSAPAIRRTRSEESLTRAMSQMHIQRPMPPPLDFYLNNSRHFAPIQPNARTNTRTNARTRRNQQNSDDSTHYVSSNASISSGSSDSSSTRERRASIRRTRRRTRTTRRRRR